MNATFPPAAQRPCLLEFRQAIGAREASLRRDDCGDWAVSGTSGHVYAIPEGFQLVVSTGESARRWGSVKKRLAFWRVTQDGDDEGCLTLDRLPTLAESTVIREALGIRKAPALSDVTKPKLIARISGLNAGKTAKLDAVGIKLAADRFQGKKWLISGVSGADGQSTGTAPRGIVEDSRV